jgi:hypothetical protein
MNKPHNFHQLLLHEDMALWPVLGLVGLGVGAHLGSGEDAMDQRSLIRYSNFGDNALLCGI